MGDDPAADLEQAIADAGTLLLRVDKYRRGQEADVVEIRRTIDDIGARARRLHRAGTDAQPMAALRREARECARALDAVIAAVLAGTTYRDAVAAFRHEDDATLQPLLLQIFSDVTPGPEEGDLFAPIAWSGRRGPRPADEVVAFIDAVRDGGFIATGDVLAPGCDPELPAVTFGSGWPDGAPLALLCRAEDLDGPSIRGPADEVLIHRPRLRVPFQVGFQLDREAVDDWVEDLSRYRQALAPLLANRGYVTREIPTPAAP